MNKMEELLAGSGLGKDQHLTEGAEEEVMCKICRECVGCLRDALHAMLGSGGFVLRNEGLLDLNGGMDVKNLHKKIVEA